MHRAIRTGIACRTAAPPSMAAPVFRTLAHSLCVLFCMQQRTTQLSLSLTFALELRLLCVPLVTLAEASAARVRPACPLRQARTDVMAPKTRPAFACERWDRCGVGGLEQAARDVKRSHMLGEQRV